MHSQSVEDRVNKLISLNRKSTKEINIFQQTKRQKQSIEIMGNYAKMKLMINSNNFSNSSRLIPISNPNKARASNDIKSPKYHTKITKNKFLETFYQIKIKERKIKHVHTNFYTGSLKTELHLVS